MIFCTSKSSAKNFSWIKYVEVTSTYIETFFYFLFSKKQSDDNRIIKYNQQTYVSFDILLNNLTVFYIELDVRVNIEGVFAICSSK